VDSGGPRNPSPLGDSSPDPSGEGTVLGVVPPLKSVRLCKQQTRQQHGAADLSAGDSVSQRKCSFRMNLPGTGVTSAGAMRHFIQIQIPVVV